MSAVPNPMRARSLPMFIILILLILVAAACSSGAGTAALAEPEGDRLSGDSAPAPSAVAEDAASESGAGLDTAGGEPAGDGASAALIEQRIVKTGEVSVEVAEVQTAVGQVRAFALDLGGYVGGSQAGSQDEGATLTLRVPAARFDEALERLRALDGEVVAEATRESDVTRQIIDTEARIANLEASEASYRILLERAERIDDILAVQSRLDQVRGEIEQLKAQLTEIEGDADLSTLTVSLIPVAEPVEAVAEAWDPGQEVGGALASVVGIGQGLLNALIWFAIVWLPVLLILALLVLVALRGVLEVRRRLPAAAGPAAGSEVPPA